ncbi:MAG: hypothetical protein ACYSU1_08490, partial [Planctomycetota bacterium]
MKVSDACTPLVRLPRMGPSLFLATLSCLLTSGWAQTQATAPQAPLFQERPGELEFSGWMIVRPATSEARAVMRLQDQVIEHVPETHEYIVSIPPGHDENSYARYLMSTGDYQYVEPDWLCFPTQVTPNDPSYWQQWHHDKLGSPFAWSLERGGPS